MEARKEARLVPRCQADAVDSEISASHVKKDRTLKPSVGESLLKALSLSESDA